MSSREIEESKYGLDKKAKKLTAQQQTFLREMLKDTTMNPTKAARAAGYKQPGVQGPRLVNHPLIKQALGKEMRERNDRTKIEADEVLRILYDALTLDPLELFDSGPDYLSLKDLNRVPENIRRLITKMEAKTRTIDDEGNTETTIKVEWVSKELALQLAGKHVGLFQDKGGTQVNVNVINDQNLVAQMRQRVEDGTNVIDGTAISKAVGG